MSPIRDTNQRAAIVIHKKAAFEINQLSKALRCEIGEALLKLQYGVKLGPPLSRPMPVVTPGVHELRIGDRGGTYRVFYYVKSTQGILVFHAFKKKSQQTPLREIAVARKRLKELLTND